MCRLEGKRLCFFFSLTNLFIHFQKKLKVFYKNLCKYFLEEKHVKMSLDKSVSIN